MDFIRSTEYNRTILLKELNINSSVTAPLIEWQIFSKYGKQTTSDIEINHPEEVSELLLRLTGEELPGVKEIRNGGRSMEKYFEPLFERKKAEGKAEGESCLAKLISRLLSEGKNDVLKDVLENESLRHGLYKEYGIQ